jgi:hypothetical protein
VRRTNVVVPADLVAGLSVPPLAVTTGEAATEWVDLPVGRWRWQRRPAQRLPLDPRSARRARRYLRIPPWYPIVPLLGWLAVLVVGLHSSNDAPLIPLVLLALWSLPALGAALPRQTPVRTALGDLRLSGLPIGVAQQWAALNTGVTLTDEPEPRRYSRSFYTALAISLLAIGGALGALLANDGRGDSALLWITVVALVAAGIWTALKTLPRGYISFEPTDG